MAFATRKENAHTMYFLAHVIDSLSQLSAPSTLLLSPLLLTDG